MWRRPPSGAAAGRRWIPRGASARPGGPRRPRGRRRGSAVASGRPAAAARSAPPFVRPDTGRPQRGGRGSRLAPGVRRGIRCYARTSTRCRNCDVRILFAGNSGLRTPGFPAIRALPGFGLPLALDPCTGREGSPAAAPCARAAEDVMRPLVRVRSPDQPSALPHPGRAALRLPFLVSFHRSISP